MSHVHARRWSDWTVEIKVWKILAALVILPILVLWFSVVHQSDEILALDHNEAATDAAGQRIWIGGFVNTNEKPLRDVAVMMRSLHYVSAHALSGRLSSGAVRVEDLPILEPAMRAWRVWASAAFLRQYLETAAGGAFAPVDAEEARRSVNAYLLERALHEIAYEIDQRQDWVHIPLAEVLEMVKPARE